MSLHTDYALSEQSTKSPQPVIQSDPIICPRAATVRKLALMLDEKRVIHVRGTPSSGKTVLANLLWHYYRNRREPVVLLHQWHNVKNPMRHLVEKCHENGYTSVQLETFSGSEVVFLLDEAQQSYGDLDLWLGIIKTHSGRICGPKFCLFTSYGSPTSGPAQYPIGTTPVRFSRTQRVSITASLFAADETVSLFYTPEEFEDVVQRFCLYPTHAFTLTPDARNYLYTVTNGHPGATDALLKYFFSVSMFIDPMIKVVSVKGYRFIALT
ncbi:hypothetical protein VTN77DRAFT_1228 [Rasamsonia byssochlamydoides]|uniref:uncharacterized protein n=1 Tax=Rasamsonia byssochlamydoides TaxID=89139 RepID=UPI0037445DF2